MNKQFELELQSVIEKYPDLSIRKKTDGSGYLKGILNIPDDLGRIAGSFSIEIHSTSTFPYRYPKVYEVGGDIPIEADWHKYDDNSCCLTVEQKELIDCHYGIILIHFVEKIVIPYFANQIYRKATGHYLNEYPHGLYGIKMFYSDLFGSHDINFWKTCVINCFTKGKFERNHKCYCGSGKKFKHCHLPIEEKLQMLGKEKVMNDLKRIFLL
ncbi:MAG: SEC-C domain-containing protein [Paludibacter sp.]|nr:SEC-C domain-containing protein [Paludibacter sp.]